MSDGLRLKKAFWPRKNITVCHICQRIGGVTLSLLKPGKLCSYNKNKINCLILEHSCLAVVFKYGVNWLSRCLPLRYGHNSLDGISVFVIPIIDSLSPTDFTECADIILRNWSELTEI